MSNLNTQNPWIVTQKPNARAALRLFCFPYAGGSAVIYRDWAELLPPFVEVCAVQLPGRGARMREAAISDLSQLVESADAALRPHFDKPFAFFGHSMGAVIGFELARRLLREGGPLPRHLSVSGRSAPQFIDTGKKLYALPDDELIEELRGLNGTPPELLAHPELMELMLPLLRADFAVCQKYTHSPEPKLPVPITAFGGLQDTNVPREELEGWREQTTAAFKARLLPGDHFFVNTMRPTLLRALTQELHALATAVAA
jgi:medium-chain acyl-[acyl-carrier-protein] hydrolase